MICVCRAAVGWAELSYDVKSQVYEVFLSMYVHWDRYYHESGSIRVSRFLHSLSRGPLRT